MFPDYPEDQTIAVDQPLYRELREPRRPLFPDGWRDVLRAALAAFLAALSVLFLTGSWVLLHAMGGHP